MQENQSKKKKQLKSYIKYSSLTIQMALIISAGVFLGDYLDEKTHTHKTYTIICSLGSIFLAMYYALKNITNQNGKK